ASKANLIASPGGDASPGAPLVYNDCVEVRGSRMKAVSKVARVKRARPRRTNEERSAATRRKLIDTTIDLLSSKGYAATTTILVTKHARVSRGAMLHHFPSRADLLVAVAQHIVEEQRRYRRERIEQMKTGLDRVRKAGEVTWEVQRQPGTIAMLELMLATRSDRDLKRRFQPFVQFYQEFRRSAARKTAENMQTDKIEAVEDMVRVHQAALRGLAIELMFMDDMPATERALRLLARYERAFMTYLGVGFPTREERQHPEPERK